MITNLQQCLFILKQNTKRLHKYNLIRNLVSRLGGIKCLLTFSIAAILLI